MNEKERAVIALKLDIEAACIKHGLNITVYDGRIGFVDQAEKKIVALWNPEYVMPKEDV